MTPFSFCLLYSSQQAAATRRVEKLCPKMMKREQEGDGNKKSSIQVYNRLYQQHCKKSLSKYENFFNFRNVLFQKTRFRCEACASYSVKRLGQFAPPRENMRRSNLTLTTNTVVEQNWEREGRREEGRRETRETRERKRERERLRERERERERERAS